MIYDQTVSQISPKITASNFIFKLYDETNRPPAPLQYALPKLDGVGPVDNRPSTN